jgi:2'-5' RNA ligase
MGAKNAYDLNSRLYVELVPTIGSKKKLLDIVKTLKVEGRLVSPDKWHVTIIHFGQVRDAYHDLLKVVPELSEQDFLDALSRYAESSKTVLTHQVRLKSQAFELFGSGHTVLALRFETTKEILDAHRKALDYLISFFKECGLDDVRGYMKNNHNFKYAFGVKPHLTLFRNLQTIPRPFPDPPGLVLDFLPADIAGY